MRNTEKGIKITQIKGTEPLCRVLCKCTGIQSKISKICSITIFKSISKTLPYCKLPYHWFSLKDYHIEITIFLYGNICELPYFWNMVIKIEILFKNIAPPPPPGTPRRWCAWFLLAVFFFNQFKIKPIFCQQKI